MYEEKYYFALTLCLLVLFCVHNFVTRSMPLQTVLWGLLWLGYSVVSVEKHCFLHVTAQMFLTDFSKRGCILSKDFVLLMPPPPPPPFFSTHAHIQTHRVYYKRFIFGFSLLVDSFIFGPLYLDSPFSNVCLIGICSKVILLVGYSKGWAKHWPRNKDRPITHCRCNHRFLSVGWQFVCICALKHFK